MKVKEKLYMPMENLQDVGAITIVALGDSVTHGVLTPEENNYETVYWNVLKKKLNAERDRIPVNVINAGVNGNTAPRALLRLERDVLRYHPDLVIVCLGLNDINGTIDEYTGSLKKIFEALEGTDVIFMTPNMLNTHFDEEAPPQWHEYAKITAVYQTEGKMDSYIYAAVSLAKEMGVTVCDCYGEWKKLYENGTDVTKLLINRINHPIPEMHELFASKLFETIMK